MPRACCRARPPPTGPNAVADYATSDPVLTGDGNTVVVQLTRENGLSSLFSVALSNPDVFTPVSPGAGFDGSGDYDSDQSASFGGGVVAYTNNSPTASGITGEIYSVAGHTTTGLGPALGTVLSAQGNAVAFVDYTDEAQTTIAVYETTLGVSAGIAPIEGNDEIDKIDLTQAAADGLVVSGTSNAPAGSAVLLFVSPATFSGRSMPFTTAVGDDGQWTATLPEEIAAALTDGPYFLTVQVIAPTGASAQVNRLFTVDTVAPTTPTAPVLDQESNTGRDGVDTDDATPTLDGQTEPGAFVTLYDLTAGQTQLATATADENGVYTLTSSVLADGSHRLAVQAADAAGNLSPLSAATAIKVDTVPPLKPSAPALAPGQDEAALVEDTIALSTSVLVGSTEPNDTITLYDGNTPIGTVKAGSDGSYTVKASGLANGDHSLVVVATDPAGNVGPASDPLDLTVDTVPPGAPLLANVNGATLSDGGLSPSFTVTGVAAAQTTVTLQVDGVPVDADSADTRASGAYTITVPDLSPGMHSLTVTATDGAGNVSQPSAATTVTISSQSIGIPGANAINGVLLDGPIAGATVFADANGNGVLDAGEASAGTTVTGAYALSSPAGELVATGGTDTQTGVAVPGALTAPAGSTVIDPLTTLLDAYAAATGQTPLAAQPALLAALGLATTADLTTLNPDTAAAAGDTSFLVASARVMDTAVIDADFIAGQTGASAAVAFGATVAALAQAAAAGPLDLTNTSTVLPNVLTAAAALAAPGATLPAQAVQQAAVLAYYGNIVLNGATTPPTGVTSAGYVDAVERVEQGEAGPQFATASGDAVDNVLDAYTNPIGDAVSAAETAVLAAPTLAPTSDTGVSAHDNSTADATSVFTGTAAPGASVIIVAHDPSVSTTTVVGLGTANAGGAYAITAALPADEIDVVALQLTPGMAVAVGDAFSLPAGLTGEQVTALVVGFLPEHPTTALPSIQDAEYTASSANDATHTSLYVTGDGSYDIRIGATYTVTANGVPIAVGAAEDKGGNFGIQTVPLAAGTYNLVVTETALDGETVQSLPYTVTVTAPGSLEVTAEAAGLVAGGSVVPFSPSAEDLVVYPAIHPNGTTDAAGQATIPLQDFVSDQSRTLTPLTDGTDTVGLELEGGGDTLTGLSLPLNLYAPPGATVITPATSLLEQADIDAESFGSTVTTSDYAFENSRIDTALGQSSTVDLATADPLAMAQAGNASLFLKDIELLDTIILLTPFTQDGAAAHTADPLTVIDTSLGIYKFDGFIGGNGPTIPARTIDFTSAAQVLAWMTTYDSTPIFGSEDTSYDASVLPGVAAIIAAGNAAIEAHAASEASVADAISYALAIERIVANEEEPMLAGLASTFNIPVSAAQQQAGVAALQTAFTGSALAAAVATSLAQTAQVTDFTPATASTTAAYQTFTITFSAPVGGVTAGNFTASDGAGLVGAAVTSVAPVAGSNGAAYTVTVSTGVGAGTLTLGFTPSGLTNEQGLPLGGGGNFAVAQSYSSPVVSMGESGFPGGLAIGDFNGDGRPDVVTANYSIDGLTLYADQADGSFVPALALYTGSGAATQIVAGDLNGDGKLDAVTLNQAYTYQGVQTVSALLGNGDGTFGAPIQTDVGPSATAIVTADFDGDGKSDLAVLEGSGRGGGGGVQLFHGNGDGTFTAGPTADLGAALNPLVYSTDEMVEADLNGDGKPDLVISTASNTGIATVTVLLGDGHGGFTVESPLPLGLGQTGVLIAVGDINGDGVPDIVAVPRTTGGNEVAAVLLGHGDGTFQAALSVPLPLPPGGNATTIDGDDVNQAVAIGDVTGDGHADIVVANNVSGVAIAPGNGDGTFGAGLVTNGIPTNTTALALADFNGDGLLDLVSTQSVGSQLGTSVGAGIAVALNTPQTVLSATATTTVMRAAEAQPALLQASGPGSLTHTGNSYTLDLGTLAQNSAAVDVLALTNAAAAPGDSFDGAFSAPAGSGFAVTGAALVSALAAGQSEAGLTFTADTSMPGVQSETITFAPRDLTDDPPVTPALPADLSASDEAAATLAPVDADGGDVALELAPITLTVTDTVAAGTTTPPGAAVLGPVAAIRLPNARVGSPDTAALPVANTAPAAAAVLDVTATATGAATTTGAVTGLAAGATDATDLTAGLSTAAAGAQTGTITLQPVSDSNGVKTALATVPVAVSGSVFRDATAQAPAVNAIKHVGDPGSAALTVTNADPADGFSESLIAAIDSVTAGLTVAAGSATGDIAPGAADSTLLVGFSTAFARTITGTAMLALTTDGGSGAGSLDGLGKLALADAPVAVAVTVDNFAQATLAATGGTLSGTASGGYTIDFGTVAQGSTPVSVALVTRNSATGPADLLAGSYAATAGAGFIDTGFAAFSGDAAGQADAGGTIALQTGQAGAFSETIVLHPTGSNASGYAGALADQTVTIRGIVQAPGGVTAPPAPTLLLTPPADGPEAGNAASAKAITNTPTPIVTGVAADGAQVALASGATGVGTLTADPATGAYSAALQTALAAGVSTVTATAATSGGTSPASAPASVYDIPQPQAGTSSPDIASLDVGSLFDAGYTLQFVAGTELAALVDGNLSVGPDTDEAYLQRLYEGLFHRGNDASGMQFWDDLLSAAAPKASIAADFMTTPEYLATFPNQAQAPDSQFVTQLYQGFLGRAPTADNLAYWGHVADAYGRQYVLADIADSAEAKTALAATTAQVWGRNTDGTLVHELFETGLNREVELPALAFWKNTLQTNALTPLTLAQVISTEPEFTALHAGQDNTAYIASLYQADFGRAPDAAGAQFWGSLLAAGTLSRPGVLLGIATAPESIADQTRNL